MKLELKHVIPYPLGDNGIKIMTSLNQGAFITPITQIDFNEPDLVYGNNYMDIDDGYYPYNLEASHLILRPLSDLTNYIEVKGERLLPCSKFGLSPTRRNLDHLKSKIENEYISYKEIQILFEWHFDVSNLIPEGLAIDINTLE